MKPILDPKRDLVLEMSTLLCKPLNVSLQTLDKNALFVRRVFRFCKKSSPVCPMGITTKVCAVLELHLPDGHAQEIILKFGRGQFFQPSQGVSLV